MGFIGAEDEVFPKVRDAVDEDGVHADNDEREGPAAVGVDVDDGVKRGEDEEAPTGAEHGPGGSPDAFDDGVEAGEMNDDTGGEADEAGFHEEEKFLLRRAFTLIAEPLAGDEAEKHRAEGWDETEREVSAAVVGEWFFAREKIHEPLIESGAEIPVFIPMRSEAGEVRPISRDADGLPVEAGGWEWIERPGGPIADEDGGERDPLGARAGAGEEK